MSVRSPIFSFVVGEGGSGGAVAMGMGNKVVMLEHSIYSVISPEGCASILWRSINHSEKLIENLKLTAQDLLDLEVIDEIIKEPIGGAHRNVDETCNLIKDCLERISDEFENMTPEEIILHREKNI